MGRGAAPAPCRLIWSAPELFLLVTTLLLGVPRILTTVCPTYCNCEVTMQSFHHVNCERASMDYVPRQLPSKSNTTYLSMKWNYLTILRERDLDDFTKLQGLNLDQNKLVNIDRQAFRQCPQLKLVRLAHNNLRTLDPELFMKNTYLQYLDLSFNKLILPGNRPFLKSRSLVFLNLTHTDLTEIPVSAFSEIPNIGQLELNNNLLTKVNVKALNVFTNRNVTVLMSGNPLRCDCEMKLTWSWVKDHVPHGSAAPLHLATCNQPDNLRGRSWEELRNLGCGDSAGAGASSSTYMLYAIVGLLVVIAVLVALVVWGVRRRRRNSALGKGGVGGVGRRKHRLAPPVGEYIDVLGDPPPSKEPIYDSLRDPTVALTEGKDPQREGGKDGADTQRYVTDITRNTYLSPVKLNEEGPIYVNMKGPPLPLRGPSDVPLPPSEPAPLAPAADDASSAAKAVQSRPCSIPLLEGCDFYEVVN